MATPELMALVKRHQNPLIFNDSPLTGVNTPGSDENSMKLNKIWCTLCCWVAEKKLSCCEDKELLLIKIADTKFTLMITNNEYDFQRYNISLKIKITTETWSQTSRIQVRGGLLGYKC